MVFKKQPKLNLIYRVIDANFNRAKEGLRVCEELARFLLDDRPLTESFKRIRHKISRLLESLPEKSKLTELRDSAKDVGFGIKLKHEFIRSGYRDIFFANISRVKESIRVLEEFFKLQDIGIAAQFKKIRYEVYAIEKKFAKKLSDLN